MKKHIGAGPLLLAFIFLLSFAGCGKDAPKTGPLVWKISGNGLEEPSYIFAHGYTTITTGMFDSIPGFSEAFESCPQIVAWGTHMEKEGEVSEKLLEMVRMPADTSYSDILSEEEYHKLDSLFKAVFGGLRFVYNYRPFFHEGMLAIRHESSLDYQVGDGETLYDYTDRMRRENNKKIISLGTFDEQVREILWPPMEYQVQTLINKLENLQYYDSTMLAVYHYYWKGDLDSVRRLGREASEVFQPDTEWKYKSREYANEILVRRTEKIPGVISRAASFIVIGVDDVAGDDGVLSRLREMGYTVEPITQ